MFTTKLYLFLKYTNINNIQLYFIDLNCTSPSIANTLFRNLIK